MPSFLVHMHHEPSSCAFGDETRREVAMQAMASLGTGASELGIDLLGAWADVVGHRVWIFVSADGIEPVEQLIRDSRMFTQNTVEIEFVRPLDEVGQLVESMG